MESDNSGSGQSSSGDDQQHDSLNLNPHHHPHQVLGNSFLQSHHHHQNYQPTTFFDLSPNYLHNIALSQSQQPNSIPNNLFHNLDRVQSQGLRSEQNNCTDPSGNNQSFTSSSLQLRSINEDNNNPPAPTVNMAPARNPKKRTRASRRAPTTVLTTDTSNFRAMVQEFTGIPAPPFSAGGSSYSRRLDLSMGGFFPLRSSQPNPLFSASNTLLQNNMVDAIASTTNIAANSGSVVNYQLPPNYNHHLGLPNYPHGLTTFQPPLPVPSLIMMNSETRNDQGIIPLRHDHVYKDIESYGGDPSQPRVATGGSSFCKLSFPASSSSMEINNVSCTSSTSRPHPGVDTWICPSE